MSRGREGKNDRRGSVKSEPATHIKVGKDKTKLSLHTFYKTSGICDNEYGCECVGVTVWVHTCDW